MAALRVLVLLALVASPVVLAESSVMKQLSSSQFTGFMKLVEHAGVLPEIEEALKAGKGLTVFAPTDDALMYHTSPTLLAFLKLAENKEHLRKVVLSHIVTERLSPFQWEGHHSTLEGAPLKLSMDANAFYADKVAVSQYNALVAGDASVHALPTLMVPSSIAGNTKTFVEEATEVRRVLVGAAAPGPEPIDDYPPTGPVETPTGDNTVNTNGAAKAIVSSFTVAAALVAALLF